MHDLSRRSLLQLSAGAAAVGVAGVPAVAEVAPPVEAVAVPASATIWEPAWKWYYAANEVYKETYDGPFKTKEEALNHAFLSGEEEIHITEAHQEPPPRIAEVFDHWHLKDYFCNLLENSDLDDLNPEEDAWADVPEEDFRDLEKRLNAAARAWFIERGIARKMNVWVFQGQRNDEIVRLSETETSNG